MSNISQSLVQSFLLLRLKVVGKDIILAAYDADGNWREIAAKFLVIGML